MWRAGAPLQRPLPRELASGVVEREPGEPPVARARLQRGRRPRACRASCALSSKLSTTMSSAGTVLVVRGSGAASPARRRRSARHRRASRATGGPGARTAARRARASRAGIRRRPWSGRTRCWSARRRRRRRSPAASSTSTLVRWRPPMQQVRRLQRDRGGHVADARSRRARRARAAAAGADAARRAVGQAAPERQPGVAVERRRRAAAARRRAAAAAAARRRHRPRAAAAARRPSGRAAPRPAARGPCGCARSTRSVSRGRPSSSDDGRWTRCSGQRRVGRLVQRRGQRRAPGRRAGWSSANSVWPLAMPIAQLVGGLPAHVRGEPREHRLVGDLAQALGADRALRGEAQAAVGLRAAVEGWRRRRARARGRR